MKKLNFRKGFIAATVIFVLAQLLSFLISIIPAASADGFTGAGAGTSGDPFQIASCTQLQQMNLDKSSYFKLVDNIDCALTPNFTPVGTDADPFTGQLDGQGFTILDLTITNNALTSDIGLFGFAQGGTIKNVVLYSTDLTNTVVDANYIGALVGKTEGETVSRVNITDLTLNGKGDTSGGQYVGGAIGFAVNSNISKVEVTGTSSVVGDFYVGGLIGIYDASGSLVSTSTSNSLSNATVTGNDYVGGFIGIVVASTDAPISVLNSYSSGNVTVNDANAGSFLYAADNGFGGDIIIQNSFSTGTVTGDADNFILDTGTNIDYSTDYSRATCALCGDDGIAASSWYNTSSFHPLSAWNFTTIWETVSGTFPDIRFDPVIVEVTPVVTPSDGSNLQYTFYSNMDGTAAYYGSCTSSDTTIAEGNNTITFDNPGAATISDCQIIVTILRPADSNTLDVTSFTVVPADAISPTASISYNPSQTSYNSGTALTITATFSEAMADTPVPQISLSGSQTVAATNMTKVDSTHYTYAHTVGAGSGVATVALSTGEDLAGNPITSAPTSGETFQVDNTAPTATITSTGASSGDTLQTDSLPMTVTFSEDVADFSQDDVTVHGGTISNFVTAVNYTQFTFTVTFSATGLITVNVPVNMAHDSALNGNPASTEFSINRTVPTVGGSGGTVSSSGGAGGAGVATGTGDVTGTRNSAGEGEAVNPPNDDVVRLIIPAPVQQYNFDESLKFGQRDIAVKRLQEILNANGFTIASVGPGSPGKETNYFGSATRRALKKFQEKYSADLLAPRHARVGNGKFGTLERDFINKMIQGGL